MDDFLANKCHSGAGDSHGGKLLSCFFFLDDHSSHQPDVQYWKYAVTGCSLLIPGLVLSELDLPADHLLQQGGGGNGGEAEG